MNSYGCAIILIVKRECFKKDIACTCLSHYYILSR